MTLVFFSFATFFFVSARTDCPMITVKTQDPRCTSEDMWMWTATDLRVASFLSDALYGRTLSCDPNMTAEQVKDGQGEASYGTAKVRSIIHQPEQCPLTFQLKDLEGSTPNWKTVIAEWSAHEQAVPTAVALKDATTESLELKVIAG
eukprot:CAMPEP_0182502790 /NCGR_PEP_ID=MMETSP1321-20130603/14100_1 /TAXON_ID=91990 /ORGANISM="Bolidomonas sp., Strain RCC1657" /LENGTH=146 /DNA_ID=CAMNT_0024707807 /DNA_START=63 /DNA_END=500 /DNA_ORIENTATION=-